MELLRKFKRRSRLMGQKASCCATSTQISPHGVLVLHVNGQADEFPRTVKAKEVLRHASGSHFLCRWKDVQLHFHAVSPLRAEDDLRMGEIYMVMPTSVLDCDVSPIDLVALGSRLLAAAKKNASRSNRRRVDDGNVGSRSSSRLLGSCENEEVQMAYKEHLHLLDKTRSWKPRLRTIQESSWVRFG